MRRYTLALLFLSGAVMAGMRQASMQPVRPIGGDCALKIPEDFRPVLTFCAPLKNNLSAFARGSNTPTYARNSVASYLSPSTGLIAYVVANEPRFEANGYLSEGARTNGFKDSAYLINGWSSTNLTTTGYTVSITAPDGTSATGYVLAEDATNGVHRKFCTYTATNEKSQAMSIYAKAGGRTSIALMMSIGGGGGGSVSRVFNLSSGTLGSGAIAGGASLFWESSSSITLAPNGWYRCVMVTGTTTGTAWTPQIYMVNTGSYSGDNSSSLFIWGAQVEDNASTVSAYQPTTTTALARQQDALSYVFAGNGGSGTGLLTTNGVRGAFDASSSIGITAGFAGYRNLIVFGNTTLTDWEKGLIRQ